MSIRQAFSMSLYIEMAYVYENFKKIYMINKININQESSEIGQMKKDLKRADRTQERIRNAPENFFRND